MTNYDTDEQTSGVLMLVHMGDTKTLSREGHGFQPTTTFLLLIAQIGETANFFKYIKKKVSAFNAS